MTRPFQIFEVSCLKSGHVGICQQPGSSGDLRGDLDAMAAWQPDLVVTMTCEDEFPKDTIFLPLAFLKETYDWLHLPLDDYAAPPTDAAQTWADEVAHMSGLLAKNARILIHCRGGRGRSGMMALRLMVAQGEPASEALLRLRGVRAGAVETDAQLNWAIYGGTPQS